MAKMWTNGGEYFETEDDARENVCQEMTWDDYEEYFHKKMDFHKFFTTVREKMPDFFERFEDDFCQAENDYFEENYWEEEVEEEQRRGRYSF